MSYQSKEKKSKLKDLINSIQKEEPSFIDKEFDWSEDFFLNNYNYILTEKAKERLGKLYEYIKKGIPIILEGETGTSKTLSAEIICKYIYEKNKENEDKDKEENDDEKMYIKFNLHSDVKISDLMIKLSGDEEFLSGMKKVEGKFFKAFKQGIPLILDEINLAPQEVLQSIEDALDSNVINIEIPNIGKVQQEMKKGFCLIATQNPNKDRYISNRQYLSKSFLSHFQVINFPPFEIDELKDIAKKLFISFNDGKEGDNKDKEFISDLIGFHNKWTSQDYVKNEIICFTIREIAASVKAYIDEKKKNSFKIVKVIYGSRYCNKEKKDLIDLLLTYSSFKSDYEKYEINGTSIKNEIIPHKVYLNNSIIEVFDSSLFSLNKGRNIIILGEEGSGKSMIARWIVQMFNKSKKINDNSKYYYHFICTEETKCSDLIGYHSPKKLKTITNYKEILEWKEGFLIKSIKEGKIVILDNLQETNSTVTERLNGLLDFKYDENKNKSENERKFDVPENPLESSIKIHPKFRIIGICNINQISKMSPAFLNRFDIISLENQLEDINTEKLKKLTEALLNCEEEKEEDKNENKKDQAQMDSDKEDSSGDIFSSDTENDNNSNIKNNNENENNSNIKNNNENENNNIIKEKEALTNFICNKLSSLNFKRNEDNENTYSIKDIARFCYSLNIILNMKQFKSISQSSLIDFVFDLLFKNNLFSEKEKNDSFDSIKKILLDDFNKKYKEKNENNEICSEFIYEKKNSLENYFAIIYASFLIHLHLCIIGPTGVGKTSSAKFISSILQDKENKYKIFPFHKSTTPKELYGTLNIIKNKIQEFKGPLAESADKGCIFIADEMNLSSKSTMNSIVPVLDPLLDKNIIIPSLDDTINVNPNFFFIACQNRFDNLGRNVIPENLKRKIKIIKYPKQTKDEIINICKEKIKKEFKEDKNIFNESNDTHLGIFMNEYNNFIEKNNCDCLKKWSFRDIDKIIKRISSHINHQNFKNFKYYHFIYFYLFSSIPKKELEKKFIFKDKNETLKVILHSYFTEIFKLSEKDSKELFDIFFIKKARIGNIKSSYIEKGTLGIKVDNLEKIMKEGEFNEDLSNYYDDFFKLKLVSKNEPIILMGPSSYKTELAKFFIKNENPNYDKNFNTIYLNQKTTIEELLGAPNFFTLTESKKFYLKLLSEICHLKKSSSEKNELIINGKNNKFKNDLQYFKCEYRNNPIIIDIIDNIYNKMINKGESDEKYRFEFEPGSILLSILKQESLIFKNIHQVSTEVFERFNELFGTEGILTLNEDIHQTLFSADNKNKFNQIIKLENFNNIIFIGTCPENSFRSLSETILSRFSVICVGEHEESEKEKIIIKYSKMYNINSQKNIYSIIRELKDIKKIKTLLNIVYKMNINNSYDSEDPSKMIENNFKFINPYMKLNTDFLEIGSIYKNKKNILLYYNGYIYSKASKLKIKIENKPKMETEKQFFPLFNVLNDLIHFGICTFTPLIFECSPGQGKQTSINYICELLNYEVENIVITNNFTVKDLFKKTEIKSSDDNYIIIEQKPTKLYSIIYDDNDDYDNIDNENSDENIKNKKIMFVFHNIYIIIFIGVMTTQSINLVG